MRVGVSTLSLPMERYKSKDISVMTRAIKKWTTSHVSLRQARFHHIHIFFLEAFLASKNLKAPWMVSTTVSTNSYQLALLVEFWNKSGLISSYSLVQIHSLCLCIFHSGCNQSYEVFRRADDRRPIASLVYLFTNNYQLALLIDFQKISGSLPS